MTIPLSFAASGGDSALLFGFSLPLPPLSLQTEVLAPFPQPVTVGLQLTNLLVLALRPAVQALPVCHQTVRTVCSTWQPGYCPASSWEGRTRSDSMLPEFKSCQWLFLAVQPWARPLASLSL